MLKLYYSKGSSALAAHIILEEVGALYETKEISIPKGQHHDLAFLQINPKGRIPALLTPDGVLTENPAILEYIAATHPDAGLVPDDPYQQAQARALCAYLCATVHVAYAHLQRGARWAEGSDAIKMMQQKAPSNLADCAEHLENGFSDGTWAMGAQYSFCDPYLFLIGKWMAACDIALSTYPKLAAHAAAMRNRPATQHVLVVHGMS
jgi:glutathione S-transferase